MLSTKDSNEANFFIMLQEFAFTMVVSFAALSDVDVGFALLVSRFVFIFRASSGSAIQNQPLMLNR